MSAANQHQILIRGRPIAYRLRTSRSARKLRVRVGFNGVEVVQPANRTNEDAAAFLDENAEWVADQLERVNHLRRVRLTERRRGEILFRGERTPIRIEPISGNSLESLKYRIADRFTKVTSKRCSGISQSYRSRQHNSQTIPSVIQ